MKKIFVLLLFCLIGCTGGKNISYDSFNDVSVGASVDELIAVYGEPYAINPLKNGEEEYEYIERIIVANRTLEVRHYFFIVKDNKVAYKRFGEDAPKDKRNSYDLQTTYK
jgi:hypothetical protein